MTIRRTAEVVIKAEPSDAIRDLRRVGQEISALHKHAARPVTMPVVAGGTAATMGAAYMPGVGFVAGSAAMARRGAASDAAVLKSAQTEAAVVGTAAAARVAGGWERARGAIRGMSGALFSLQGLAVTYGVSRIVRSASDAASTMEKLRRSFAVFYGDAERGNRELARVIEIGKKTMFEAVDIAQAKRLLKAYQLDSERVLMAVADAAAATGYQLESVAMALGRLKSGTYGEAFEMLRRLGVTRKELESQGLEFTKAGQFVGDAEQAIDAVVRVFRERFGDMAITMNRTWQGRLSTMSDNWKQFVAPLGELLHQALMPVIDGIGQSLEDMTLSMKDIKTLATEGTDEDILRKLSMEETARDRPGLGGVVKREALDLVDTMIGGLTQAYVTGEALRRGQSWQEAMWQSVDVHQRHAERIIRRMPTRDLERELEKARTREPELAPSMERELFRRRQITGELRRVDDRGRINDLVAELGQVEQQRITGEADVRRGIRGQDTERLALANQRRIAEEQPPAVRDRLLVEIGQREQALAGRREAGLDRAGELARLEDRADAIVQELRGLQVRVIVPQDRAVPRQAVPIARPQPLAQAERIVPPERISALSTWRTQQTDPFRDRRTEIIGARTITDRNQIRRSLYPPPQRDAASYAPLPWPGAELSMYEPAPVPREAYQQQPPATQPQPAQVPPAAAMQSSMSIDNRSVNIYASSPPSALVGMARQYWER